MKWGGHKIETELSHLSGATSMRLILSPVYNVICLPPNYWCEWLQLLAPNEYRVYKWSSLNIRKHGCIIISARGWTLSTCPWKVWRKTISCFQRFWWFKLHPHVHEKYEKKPYPGFKDFGGSQCMRGSLQFHQLSLRHEKCSTERFPFSPNCPHASDQIGLPQKYRVCTTDFNL